MDKDQADKIIELLQKLVDMSDTGKVKSDLPWTYRLLQEVGTGEDVDGNGLVYGHDFIFKHVLDWLPPDLQPTQESLQNKFKGKKITVLEYAESLPDDDPKIDVIYNYAKTKQSLNG